MSRQELTAATTFYVDPAGSDSNDGTSAHPWQHGQHALDYILGSVDCRGFPPCVQFADHAYNEQLNMSGSCQGIFIRGNHANPRAVSFTGIQVRDHATLLFYDLSTPWVILAQNSIIDADNFVLCSGSPPSGIQLSVDASSSFNCSTYAYDVGATCHLYVGAGATFRQSGGVNVSAGYWPTFGTFYKAEWGGQIAIAAGVNYVDGSHVTSYVPVDTRNRGMVATGGNAIPGSLYNPNQPGDGLIT